MNRISLSDAVSEILIANRYAADHADPEPFFFIVGAGISAPAIPLASEIQRQCEDEAQRQGRKVCRTKTAIESYSVALDAAYPHALARQRYLKDLMHRRPITPANLRLAHLLLSGRLATIAVTPNFDDLLSRALALLGERDFHLCDHPATVERINHEVKDLQIVHVHGTYWFYDLVNLQGEMSERARVSHETAFTMVGLLDRILTNRSPLVVGYSGWEGDVIMTALKRRLYPYRRLPYRLYWFCYESSSPESLPDWLREHPDVFFVYHPESRALRMPSTFGRRRTDRRGGAPRHSSESPLPAEVVFEELMRALELDEPKLFKDPFEFYADFLKRSLPDGGPDGIRDVYSIEKLIADIRTARRSVTEPELEPVRQAVRRSQYHEAIREAEELLANAKGRRTAAVREHAAELVKLLTIAAHGSAEGSPEQSRSYDLILRLCDAASVDDVAPMVHASIARARNSILAGDPVAAYPRLEALRATLADAPPEMRDEAVRAESLLRIAQFAREGGEVERTIARDLAVIAYNVPARLQADDHDQFLLVAGERLLQAYKAEAAYAAYKLLLERTGQPLSLAQGPELSPSVPEPELVTHASARLGLLRAMAALQYYEEVWEELHRFIELFQPRLSVPQILRAHIDAWALRDEVTSALESTRLMDTASLKFRDGGWGSGPSGSMAVKLPQPVPRIPAGAEPEDEAGPGGAGAVMG